ncbi:MAG: hypothetical protein R3C20_00255 [Planctomycetaceae bacterium]
MKQAESAITSIDSAVAEYKANMNAVASQTVTLRAENQSKANVETAAVVSRRSTGGQVRAIIDDTLGNIDQVGWDSPRNAAIRAFYDASVIAGVDPTQAGRGALGYVASEIGLSTEDRKLIQAQLEVLKDLQRATIEMNQTIREGNRPSPQKQIAVIGAQMKQGEGSP